MALARLDRTLIKRSAIVSVPLELVALFGLYTFLFEETYGIGTKHWSIAYGMAGFCVHFFGILLVSTMPISGWAVVIVPFFGYADLFFFVILVGLGLRMLREFYAKRCPQLKVPVNRPLNKSYALQAELPGIAVYRPDSKPQ